jgi:hypothetical protein
VNPVFVEAAADVLNASALLAPRPFRPETRHAFTIEGARVTATIVHRLRLEVLTEQVTWRGRENGRPWVHRDPEDALRPFFPQEMALLAVAGFPRVALQDGYARWGGDLAGRRLVAIAR